MKLFFKSKILILTFLLVSIGSAGVGAQNSSSEKSMTIIDQLLKDEPNSGVIRIKSDPKITALIGKVNASTSVGKDPSQYLKMSGFRINVFSGNNQRQSKDEATSKERTIKSAFPDLSTYLIYTSPIWKLRVGDFQTNEEAVVFMRELKQALPDLGKEMYVVPDEIKVPFNE